MGESLAAVVKAYGALGVETSGWAEPEPGPGEVVISTRFSSLNPVDLETVIGKNKMLLPLRPPFVPGVDVAGTVSTVGAGVEGWAPGERVAAYTGVPVAGAWSTSVSIPATSVARVPDSVSFEQAAALCLPGLAAWQALDSLQLDSGQRVLIHGAAGAVGGAAAQLAVARGLEVWANLHSRDRDRVRDWGVARVLCYDEQSFRDECSDLHGVVDTVGGDTYKQSFGVVRPGGAIATLTAVPAPAVLRSAGFAVPWVLSPVLRLMSAPAEKNGVRVHPIVTVPDGKALAGLLSLAADGRLTAHVGRSVALSDVGGVWQKPKTEACARSA